MQLSACCGLHVEELDVDAALDASLGRRFLRI